MKILAVHGLGGQEKNPDTWQPGWKDAFEEVIERKGGAKSEVAFAKYDDIFGDTQMTVGGTASGFGRLLWDEVKFGVIDKASNLWPFRRRGFGDGVNDVVKWKIGMVTQFAEDADLREELRDALAAQIEAHEPDVVFAHSLGTLITYSLLLNKDYKDILAGRTYITAGCQIGRGAVRSLFGGRLTTVNVSSWFNLHNRHDDVLVVPLNIVADNFRQIDTDFDSDGIGDHDALGYIRHTNAVNTVWRQVATMSTARVRALGAEKKANRFPSVPVAPAIARQSRRALLIGINDYPNPDDRLEGCVNDVFKMSAALQQIGFEPEEIRVVLNERATAAGIRERFAWLMEDPQPGDVRVLFFSGHGAQIPDYGSDETIDHKDETLVPYDFNWSDRSTHLTDDDLNALYTQLPYDMTFIAFFDCCHSGGIARSGGAKVRGLNPPDDIRHRELAWNWKEQVWEPRHFAEKRKGVTKSYIAGDADYVGKDKHTNRLLRGLAARQLDQKSFDRRKAKFGHKGPYLPLVFEACQEGEFAYEYRDGVTSYGGYTYFLTQELFNSAVRGTETTFTQLHERAKKLLGQYFQQTPQLLGPSAMLNAKVPRREPARPGGESRNPKRQIRSKSETRKMQKTKRPTPPVR